MKHPDNSTTVEQEKVPFKRLWQAAPSLRPGTNQIFMACVGNEYACAIREAWKFDHDVTVLSQARYRELIARYEGLTFNA